MRIGGVASAIVIGLLLVLALPARADAQSAFAGAITDTTGAPLPGVTVEASSPALIERNRTVVTDEPRRVQDRRFASRAVQRGVFP
jgi:hypothetical protein